MKNTRHATTNYRMLLPFIQTADENGGYSQFRSEGYMPLSIEYLHYLDYFGDEVYAMSHTGIMNGDLMRDPEITFSVNHEKKTIRPLTFRNDYAFGYYVECFESARLYYPKRLTDTDNFLNMWLKNLDDQGFNPFAGIKLENVTSWEA